MNSKTTSRRIAVLALAAALTASGVLAQQSQSKSGKPLASAKSGMMSGKMGEQCKEMMAMHAQMMAEMKAMDSILDQKVVAMNAADGAAKVDAIAVVINEMATQRTQMMAKMSGMQDQMMAQMGEHMGQSGGAAMKKSMARCPMMKAMEDMDEKSTGSKKEHQEEHK